MTRNHPDIQEAIGGRDMVRVLYDEPMSRHTSIRVGGRADALAMPESVEALAELIQRLNQQGIPLMVVGNLTNILVRDGGFRGVMVGLQALDAVHDWVQPDGGCFIEAQAGAALAKAAALATTRAWTGLEFCAGIPGSVGGALRMNAGAWGAEMKDVTDTVCLINVQGELKTVRRDEIDFGYRTANLPDGHVVASAVLKLVNGDGEAIQDKIRQIMAWRRQRHPLQYPSAGSVFKNLPDLPAGRLIEEMGLKGLRMGDAQVSKQHANFIINKGRATARDVLALISRIQDTALRERGLTLETEVIVVGEDA